MSAAGREARRLDCPLCGVAPARRWRRHAGYAIDACGSCGLRITWPRPVPEELERFYARPDYYSRHAMASDDRGAWDERVAALVSRVPGHVERVLDFGAGEGHAVAALRRLGYVAEGIEPSVTGRAGARARHGIGLSSALAELATDFDLAIALHSLEHVDEPVATLRALSAHVRAGGHVFIEVPHAGSADLWLARERERILSLPAHLYHFTPQTLARVVECAGLALVEVALSNPLLLERAFAWRAARRASVRSHGVATETERAPGHAPAAVGAPAGPGGLRALWSHRLLPALRRRWPGYKFQLLARRPDDQLDGRLTSVTR